MSVKKQLLSNIKNYKFNSIFIRNMIIIFCTVSVIVSAMIVMAYSLSSSNATEYTYQSNEEMCNTVRDITDTLIDEMRALAINTSLKSEVENIMMFPENIDRHADSLVEYVKNFLFMYDYLDTMYIYNEDTHKVIANQRVYDEDEDEIDMEWVGKYLRAKSDEPIIFFRTYKNIYPYYLTIIKPIAVANSEITGAVVLNVDIKKLCRVYKNTSRFSQQEIIIVNDDNTIIYNDDNRLISTRLQSNPETRFLADIEDGNTNTVNVNAEQNVVSCLKSKNYGWKYYCITPLDFFSSNYTNLMVLLLIMLLITLIISGIISAYISLKIFTPVESIMEALESPTPWMHFQERKNENETDYILKQIATMRQSNTALIDEQEKKVMVLKNAQTMMLQLQINPHFLGNTLNVINWMAIEMTMSENDVSQAIGKLAKLFKNYSDATDYMTDLASEEEFAKQYTDILKLRYPDTFFVEWNIEEGSKNAKVPRLILQPLVENAVYHGLRPLDSMGKVLVHSYEKNSMINIVVEDSGKGMSMEEMQSLNKELLNESIAYDGHIGLKNVNQRFKLIYGSEYGLKLDKSQLGGLKVSIQIPYVY